MSQVLRSPPPPPSQNPPPNFLEVRPALLNDCGSSLWWLLAPCMFWVLVCSFWLLACMVLFVVADPSQIGLTCVCACVCLCVFVCLRVCLSVRASVCPREFWVLFTLRVRMFAKCWQGPSCCVSCLCSLLCLALLLTSVVRK